jgi:tetratricopeptide (TPR) repeat protein
MTRLLLILLLINIFSTCLSQAVDTNYNNKMENRYFTQDQFNDNFGKEMASASEVYEQRKKSGIEDYALATYDFVYISDSKNKLDSLGSFLTTSYDYKIGEAKKADGYWELTGDATEFPVDEDNLMYWALNLYCKGYQFDCKLDGYGAMADPNKQEFLKIDTSLEDHYFELAMEAYNKQNSGMAIIYFSTVIKINPKNPNAWYSRAIIKDELHTWKAARRDYDTAIALAPDFIDAIVNRAGNKDEAGEYDEAIKDYSQAILLDSTNAMAYFNRGNTKFNKGNKQDACDDWKKAKELGADYAQESIDEHCK